MWVAEMDFPTAEVITETLREAIGREMFGYVNTSQPELAAALAEFCRQRYDWAFDPAAVRVLPEVIRGVELAIDAFSAPGSAVVLPVPAYMPFSELIGVMGRRIIEVPMLRQGERWQLDLEALEEAFRQGAGSLILTNPHNPLGKTFDAAELTEIAKIVDRHQGRVVSDEIHAPLVYQGRHIPYASLSETAAAHSVTLMSTSKAWNLPGLCCAQAIVHTEADRVRWDAIPEVRKHLVSPLGVVASETAYRAGSPWLNALVQQLAANRDYLFNALQEVAGLRAFAPQATYLAWLDFREHRLAQLAESPASYLLREAKLATVDGRACGEIGANHVRLNFGTTSELLHQAVDSLKAVL